LCAMKIWLSDPKIFSFVMQIVRREWRTNLSRRSWKRPE
jgi:hypothetical protein